ncbi:MAG: AAA family ATPase [Flavobacteriaceae bacterium]|nr:AAA family ATPase [Flavobacteriaceae bacterium]
MNDRELKFDDNPKAKEAIDVILHTNDSIFLTGQAGTGKSALLTHIIEQIKKPTIKLAYTNVGAINIGGETIHKFFRIKIKPYYVVNETDFSDFMKVKQECNDAKTIIIDEVSTLRADLLDLIDLILKNYTGNNTPFGGKQMVFVGDPFQLPPFGDFSNSEKYKSPFFFSAHAYEELCPKTIELTKVYRQKEKDFESVLNRIRIGQASQLDIDFLNQKYTPPKKESRHYSEKRITLTNTNQEAKNINDWLLEKIKSPKETFLGVATGTFDGEKPKKPPVEIKLELRCGARIMLMVNNHEGLFERGTLGTITEMDFENKMVEVCLDSGLLVDIEQHQWIDYPDDKESPPKGTFQQLPLKHAWACTIHQFQGLTLENLSIDLGDRTFAEGQLYTALSRCKSYHGITLLRKIQLSDIKVSKEVLTFFSSLKDVNRSDFENNIQQEIDVSVFAFAAMVRKSDGFSKESEYSFIRDYYRKHHGREKSNEIYLSYIHKEENNEIDLADMTYYIRKNRLYEHRKPILDFLFELANADHEIVSSELKILKRISKHLDIHDDDYEEIKAKYI